MSIKENELQELLTRGVGSLIDPDNAFQKKLKENPEQIVIKFGVDVTRPDLHLGHAVVLRRLRKFQDVGCKVIFLIGDYTTMIGDPTGKSKVRPEVSQQEIEANMNTYLEQVGKILITNDPKVFSWIRNSDWFLNVSDISVGPDTKVTLSVDDVKDKSHKEIAINPNSFVGKAVIYENSRMQKTHLKSGTIHTVSFSVVLSTLRHITHSRLIERDMFQDRLGSNSELYMHEMLYPVIQGIDSAVLSNIYGSCDLEVGGSDQVFNMLVGRDVMKMNKQQPQAVLSFDLLVGLDGKEKMSKSLDNYIGVTDAPADMYGKVMSINDESIKTYFELCTYTPVSQIEEFDQQMKQGTNPKDIKMRLAREIVAIYHGEKSADSAEEDFTTKFSKREIPEDVLEVSVEKDTELSQVFQEQGIVESKSDFRRLVEEGAIHNLTNEEKITDLKSLAEEGVYKIGKKRFIKITIT